MDIVDGDGQVPENIIEEFFILGNVVLHAAEESVRGDAEFLFDPQGRAVGLQAAALAAVAEQPAGLHADVPEFSAAPVFAAVERAVHQHRTADAEFQKEIGHVHLGLPGKPLRLAAGGTVVVDIDRIRDVRNQAGDGHLAQAEGRGKEKTAPVFGHDGRERDANSKDLRAVNAAFVQKALQLRREVRGGFGDFSLIVKEDLLVGKLVQAEIGGNEPQAVFGHGDADGNPRVGHNIQTLRFAPAGGALLAGIADKAFVHQLVQILVQGGHADAAGFCQRLLGTKALIVIQRMVNPAAHGQMIPL